VCFKKTRLNNIDFDSINMKVYDQSKNLYIGCVNNFIFNLNDDNKMICIGKLNEYNNIIILNNQDYIEYMTNITFV
jgi:hypothetical protein